MAKTYTNSDSFYANAEIWEDEFDDPYATPVKVQLLAPGMYVSTGEMDTFLRVTEYPIITATGVFVNLSGGQIGPVPLDTLIEGNTSH